MFSIIFTFLRLSLLINRNKFLPSPCWNCFMILWLRVIWNCGIFPVMKGSLSGLSTRLNLVNTVDHIGEYILIDFSKVCHRSRIRCAFDLHGTKALTKQFVHNYLAVCEPLCKLASALVSLFQFPRRYLIVILTSAEITWLDWYTHTTTSV